MTQQIQRYPFARPSAFGAPVPTGTEPLVAVELPSGEPAVLVTRHADVRKLLADGRTSRQLNRPGASRIFTSHPLFSDPRLDPDPPEHSRVRRLVMKAFTPERVAGLRPRVQRIADELLDTMAAHGGPIDITEALAFPLPIRVICALLGVPDPQAEKLREWTDAFFSTGVGNGERAATALAEMDDYLAEVIEQRRETPDDGLISSMIGIHDADDGRLSSVELHWWVRLLLLVGYETTATQLGGGIAMLLAHPEQFALLRERPELIGHAVEELLRWKQSGSSVSMLRYATEDIALRHCVVPGGSSVIPAVEIANFDETVFAEPDVFDVTRADNPHLTFGFGPHFCVGASLARLEIEIAVRGLVERFPGLRLADDELRRRDTGLINRLVEVPVVW
ncbi:MAG TPA: cytochrome P450 [Pseudonocardiaceae bacterium]|nr:cytochrome P450 [Pseudonocardiaceae bacterium]